MAGVPISTISQTLGHKAVVRAMPNTPAQIGEGMTLWITTPAVSDEAASRAESIFAALGRQARVTDEKYLDMATGVSGSGPGFVLLFIEAMIDAAVHVGFGRELATEMVLQTVAGTAKLAQQSGKHPAELRAMVTSPAGTTAEGLRELEAGGLRAAVLNAVEAAYNRSKALGGQGSQK
jgi:pyrroline-5-carboxylate reductase